MKIRKVTILLGWFLLITALLALIDVISKFTGRFDIFSVSIVMQLLLGFLLVYNSWNFKGGDVREIVKLQWVSWFGIFYVFFVSSLMGIRQFNEFGFTFVLPITMIFFILTGGAPFIWIIGKLSKEKNRLTVDSKNGLD